MNVDHLEVKRGRARRWLLSVIVVALAGVAGFMALRFWHEGQDLIDSVCLANEEREGKRFGKWVGFDLEAIRELAGAYELHVSYREAAVDPGTVLDVSECRPDPQAPDADVYLVVSTR